MALFDYNKPPRITNPHGNDPVATKRGWEDPDTGELLVAIGELTTKAGAGDILEVSFVTSELAQGDDLSVLVRFNERVDVTAGASIVVTWDGGSGNVTLYAAAQTNKNEILFDKQSDNTTQEVVPSETGALSIAAQTLGGTIKDAGTVTNSNKAVSAPVAAAAGEVEVA